MKDNIVDKVIDIKSNGIGTDGSNIKYNYDGKNENIITMSELFVGIVTLNPDIIDRYSTSKKGELTLSKNKEMYGITHIYSEKSQKLKELDYSVFENLYDGNVATERLKAMPLSSQTTSAIDGFNKNNMAYFNDLFASNEEIYQHLQVFIFILVGGFFVMTIGASKIQAYLENRGESEGKQPYLHKFYIPLLMVGVFFMPIPEGNGYHSTVMQNMIRYFAQYSTSIADMANTLGTKIYIEKIYKSMGRVDEREVSRIVALKKAKFNEALSMHNTLSGCGVCLDSTKVDSAKPNTKYYDVNTKTIKDCNYCQNNANLIGYVTKEWEQLDEQYSKILNYQTNYQNVLKNMDNYFMMRNDELGWLDILLTPTSGILIETKLLARAAEDNVQSKNDRLKQVGELTKLSSTIRMSKAQGINYDEAKEVIENSINESTIGYLSGNLVWMMFPGASAIKDFLSSTGKMVLNFLSPFIFAILGLKFGALALLVSGPLLTIASYAGTIVLMKWTFAMIPLLAISTATLVAFVSYLVSLCKYFYISPFVTAWAMATKRTDKIIDFLLTGIAIFFRPILIVLFTFLALFFYIFIEDFFIFISIEQFSGISIPINKTNILESWIVNQQQHGILSGTYNFVKEIGSISLNAAENFHINFIIGAISGLLKIFGGLASSYIAWKLIVNGPTWALGLIGLDGKHDDMIASGLESNLAKRAFVA